MLGHDARGFLSQRAPQVFAAARMFPGHRDLLGLRPTFPRVDQTRYISPALRAVGNILRLYR
jgi:hypothetical protein